MIDLTIRYNNFDANRLLDAAIDYAETNGFQFGGSTYNDYTDWVIEVEKMEIVYRFADYLKGILGDNYINFSAGFYLIQN